MGTNERTVKFVDAEGDVWCFWGEVVQHVESFFWTAASQTSACSFYYGEPELVFKMTDRELFEALEIEAEESHSWLPADQLLTPEQLLELADFEVEVYEPEQMEVAPLLADSGLGLNALFAVPEEEEIKWQ